MNCAVCGSFNQLFTVDRGARWYCRRHFPWAVVSPADRAVHEFERSPTVRELEGQVIARARQKANPEEVK